MVASFRSDLQKIDGCYASSFRFVHQLLFFEADKCQNRARKRPASGSREREKVIPGWEQRLHRDTIDTFVGNAMARKF